MKFKSEVELLAKSLAKYAVMLSSKRVAMSLIHSSQQPVRSVGNSVSVLYIAPRHSPSSDLAQISSAISDADSDIPVDLQEFLPSDRRRRFDRLESLKKGLDIPIVLLTYAPGSNLINLHWAWHTSATDISTALQTCQPIIEDLKAKVPLFHSRAMRKTAFEKFGLITPTVRKSVLRHL